MILKDWGMIGQLKLGRWLRQSMQTGHETGASSGSSDDARPESIQKEARLTNHLCYESNSLAILIIIVIIIF